MLRNLLGNLVGPVAGLASAPILAQTLGVNGRGEVAAGTAPLLLAAAIATIGLPESITYVVARDRQVIARALRNGSLILSLSGLVAMGATILAAPLIAGSEPGLVPLIILGACATVPHILVAGLRGAAAGMGRWDLVAWDRSIGPVLRLIVIGVLALLGSLSVPLATAAIAFSPIAGGLVYLGLVRKAPPSRSLDPSRLTPTRPRHLLSYGSRIWIGGISGVLLMRLDQVLMIPLAGARELGLYVVAVTISELPLIVNTAIREVIFAIDANDRRDERVGSAARISFFASGCVGLGLAIPAPWWIPFLFGAGFEAAVPTCLVLLLAVVIGTPGSVAGAALSARGRPELRSISLIIACIVNAAAIVVLAPMLGALGAALATLLGNIISANLNIFFLTRHESSLRQSDFYLVRIDDVTTISKRLLQILRRN